MARKAMCDKHTEQIIKLQAIAQSTNDDVKEIKSLIKPIISQTTAHKTQLKGVWAMIAVLLTCVGGLAAAIYYMK